MRHIINRITNDNTKKLTSGTFTDVYVSKNNSEVLYLVTPYSCPDKEILVTLQGNEHMPYIERVDSFEYGSQDYTIYKTHRTNKPTKQNTEAYAIARKMNTIAERVKDQNKALLGQFIFGKKADYTQRYVLSQLIIDALKEDDSIPESIINALDLMYGWCCNYGPTFLFEFQIRNLAVDTHGKLILRDVFFFVD